MFQNQKKLILFLVCGCLLLSQSSEAAQGGLRGPESFAQKSQKNEADGTDVDPHVASAPSYRRAYSTLQFSIALYRKLVSEALGTSCPMFPTCGTYAFQALQATNDFKGFVLTIDRLLREHDVDKMSKPVLIKGRYCYSDPVQDNLFPKKSAAPDAAPQK